MCAHVKNCEAYGLGWRVDAAMQRAVVRSAATASGAYAEREKTINNLNAVARCLKVARGAVLFQKVARQDFFCTRHSLFFSHAPLEN
jgi:hypothetical protein